MQLCELVQGSHPHADMQDPCHPACPPLAEDCSTSVRPVEYVRIGCGMCVKSCPYGHPILLEEDKKSAKCDGCKPLRDAGQNPVCVDACVMRAIEFGNIDELRAKYPDAVADLPILPSSSETSPSVAILPFEAALQEEFEPFIV